MTVRENLMMVPPGQLGESLWNTWFRRGAIAEEERRLAARADEVLEFLTIDHLADEKAGNLSGGQKEAPGARPHDDDGRADRVSWTRLARG